jgi:transcriptional regulator GlxA family with amidase domain
MQLVRLVRHGDSAARRCEDGCTRTCAADAIGSVVERAGIPQRTLKRRFKAATGVTLIAYLQNLRIEEAKRLLESSEVPVEEIGAEVGYADASFFRRLFKRLAGLTPGRYRRLFQPVAALRGAPL